jgi:hypothetical protein
VLFCFLSLSATTPSALAHHATAYMRDPDPLEQTITNYLSVRPLSPPWRVGGFFLPVHLTRFAPPPSRSPPLRERRRAGEWRMDRRTRESAETSGAGLPLAVRELVAGGVAGGVAKSSVAPLERVKILFQARRSTRPPPSHFLLR